jgi:hypothetical protein
MSNETHLEDAVAKTAAEAACWHAKFKALEGQIADWTHAVTTATKLREEHGLAAALGESTALAAVKKARAEQHEAEQHLADLAAIALPASRVHLANAEKAAAAARHALAMHHGEKLMRQRVAAAAQMDQAFAVCAAAFGEYERLGQELQNFPDLNLAQGGGMARWEDAAGLKRIAAAVPICLTKLPAWTWTHPSARVPLADSEADFWSLPPVETQTSKAA